MVSGFKFHGILRLLNQLSICLVFRVLMFNVRDFNTDCLEQELETLKYET